MTRNDVSTLLSVTEVRNQLGSILARFRDETVPAFPVVFGRHRAAEAVILPYDLYLAAMAISSREGRPPHDGGRG